jgi:hypothetical protein
MKSLIFPTLLTLAALLVSPLPAEERTMTPEEMEKLAAGGDFEPEVVERPANLPDLTKGDPVPDGGKNPPPTWTLGPTGIVATFAGYYAGDQLQVQTTLKGSPSEGKLQWGDVLVGINGRKFQSGGELAQLIGNAIIEAEKEENAGRLSFMVWRDKNFIARSGKKDFASVDLDKLFAEARDDDSLYDWKPEEERAKEVRQMGFDQYPIDAETFEVELKLRTFPAYSDTAPYDCPKTRAILEDAWKVLEKKFIVDPNDKKSGRGGIIEAIALVASGKPEHREIVREWVRGPYSPWKEPTEPIGAMFEPGYRGYKGFQSWHKGFAGLYCAIYYDATGDDFVLPALRKYAIETAMGQSTLGSWGHTFAYPSFNGGKLHGMNPGYGALNAAGNRCFFLVTLARKLGIEDPEIDLAVERGRRFFGSYIDQGCIPYGDHGAYGSDDSNGKNTGVAFSLKLLGDDYGAKYFAMMSSHCAFTRRGGHGHDYHGNWSSWAANLCGPEVRAYNERNLRWRRTMCRMFDGSFVYHGGYGPLRDPTATEVLHQSVVFAQTLITGKDPNKALYPTEREMKQLLASARGQFQDPWLKELAGTPWPERSTDEVFDLLDIFFPKARDSIAKELGKRYQAGEKAIADRLLKLLESDSARFRDGALRGLEACGSDVVLGSLSKLTPRLKDPADFVRITATRVISKVTDSGETQLAMLEATIAEPQAGPPNSVRNTTQSALFAKNTTLANNPFDAGFDPESVRLALEHLILLDPAGKTFLSSRLDPWTKDTVVRVAGPLVHAAEEEQLGDQMFANRSRPARAVLDKFGYLEAVEATAHRLRMKAAIRRDARPYAGFKRPLVDPFLIEKNPAAFAGFTDFMRTVLTDNPNEAVTVKDDRTNWKPVSFTLNELLTTIEAKPGKVTMPSLADDVRSFLTAELAELDGTGAKLKKCRAILGDTASRADFRKLAAIDFLVETLGPDALPDLLPYLGHDYWRLRDHARKAASGMVSAGGADILAELFPSADAPAKAGILAVFALGDSKQGLATARTALSSDDPVVRAAAVGTLAAIEGTNAIEPVLAQLAKATDPLEIFACEDALLGFRDDAAAATTVRDGVLALLPGSDVPLRPSLYFILGRLGDATSLAALEKAAGTDSLSHLREVVTALSFSLSREADAILLRIAGTDKESAKIVGAESVRRMVLGPKGFGDLTNAERMDFAEPMLKLDMDGKLIQFLGQVHDARALRALMYCLEKGVRGAADALIANAEGIDRNSLSAADNKIAVKALKDVMEYIEVVHLRGGISAHMDKDDDYVGWKTRQARAGKAMLKLHQPETAPIPTIDPLLIDP